MNNFYQNVVFSDEKVMIQKILETSNVKEIRICLSKGQLMKEHKAPAAITIMILDGSIKFTYNQHDYELFKGDILTLEAEVKHSLLGLENSIIRLTLSKNDNVERVEQVVAN